MLSKGRGADQVGTVIGKETEIKGTLGGKGSLRIDGRLEGEVDFSGDLYVGEGARLTANVRARSVTVAGEIRGNVHAEQRVELLASARVFGDIHTKKLIIGEGALFEGSSIMEQETRSATPRAELG
ncbi:MAG TPA: polymer-forming cytoskeletal protein [Bacillota bacterium]